MKLCQLVPVRNAVILVCLWLAWPHANHQLLHWSVYVSEPNTEGWLARTILGRTDTCITDYLTQKDAEVSLTKEI